MSAVWHELEVDENPRDAAAQLIEYDSIDASEPFERRCEWCRNDRYPCLRCEELAQFAMNEAAANARYQAANDRPAREWEQKCECGAVCFGPANALCPRCLADPS